MIQKKPLANAPSRRGVALLAAVSIAATIGQLSALRPGTILPAGDVSADGSPASPAPGRGNPDPGSGTLPEKFEYAPGGVERLVIKNADAYGFARSDDPPGCVIYENSTRPDPDAPRLRADLLAYLDDLGRYKEVVEKFEPIDDLMTGIRRSGGVDGVCSATRLHPDGLPGLFPSGQLSLTSSGYVEPLLPPMRHPDICRDNRKDTRLSMDYLIHDFEAMCQKLKPSSKLVLVDMGASLDFAGRTSPIIWLLEMYEKFGLRFDHIYAFEVTPKDAAAIYRDKIPEKYIPAYHWINAGVSSGPNDRLNPLHSVVRTLDEDDLVVVKIDIDMAADPIEVPLARQLLHDETLSRLVDHFYFEHHVHMRELAPYWGRSMSGTIKESLELFKGLREAGIAAHFWP